MSATPPPQFGASSKQELGARAAALKERLLRKRGQQRDSQGPSDPAASDRKTSTTPGPQLIKSEGSVGADDDGCALASTRTSVPAGEEDIATLISSFSSGAVDHGNASSIPSKPVNSALSNIEPEIADTPAQRPILQTASTASNSQLVTSDNKNSPNYLSQEEVEHSTSIKQRSQASDSAYKNMSPQGLKNPSSTYSQTNVSPAVYGNRLNSNSDKMFKPPTPTGNRNFKSPDNTGANSRDAEIRHESEHHLTDRNKPAAQYPYTKQIESTLKQAGKEATTDEKSVVTSESPALARLLGQDRDLREWLEMTGYFNIEARNRKLERARKLAEMEAERVRIEEERRKLLEEEAMDNSFNRQSYSTPVATPVVATPAAYKEERSNLPAKRAYPESDERSHEPVAKAPRMEDRRLEDRRPQAESRDSRHVEPGHRSFSDTRYGLDTRSSTATRPASSHRPRSRGQDSRAVPYRSPPTAPRGPRLSPPLRPRELSPRRQPSYSVRYDDDHARKYDGFRSDRDRDPRDFGSRTTRANLRSFDLGSKGDSRFFIVKSFNEENVKKCMDDGVWATQIQNGESLTTAFAKCKNVILFFSINKSKAFQGFARMSTAPSPDTPRPKWMNGIHWGTTPPFRVEWLSTIEVGFHRIGHIKNRLNEDHPVLVGRDGQEIEEQAGRDLFEEMALIAETGLDSTPRRPEPRFKNRPDYRPRGRGGYPARGGHESSRFIKREENW